MTKSVTEDDIIKRKLLIDGDGLGDDRRINMAMKHFFRWFSSPNNDQDLAANYERIHLMLSHCEHSMAKSKQIMYMNQEEMSNYQQLYLKIEQGIQESQQKIIDFKNELLQAKAVRKNKQEYDALAKVIMEHPDRKKTLAQLSKLEQEIENLQQIKENLKKRLESRSKQFQVLISSAHELQKMLSQDDDPQLDSEINQIIEAGDDNGDEEDIDNVNDVEMA